MMWTLVKKYNEMREYLKHKARGTIRGDQAKAIDVKLNITPSETYAPTVRHVTCKIATATAVNRAFANKDKPGARTMRYRTSDATAAFLQGKQPGGVRRYVRPPQGFRKVDRRGIPIVWLLVGNCYGTENAPRVWFDTVVPYMIKEMNYVQNEVDPCALHKVFPPCAELPLGGRVDICVYVDDQ